MINKIWSRRILNNFITLNLLAFQIIPVNAQNHSGRDATKNLNVSLLDGAECTSFTKPARIMGAGLSKRKQKVSIERQFYYVPFTLYSSARGGSINLVCEINPKEFRLLKLKMGVPDDLEPETKITVHVYQGGNVVYTHQARPGTTMDTILNLSNTKVSAKPHNIAIEAICQRLNSRCPLLMLKSELVHISNFSK